MGKTSRWMGAAIGLASIASCGRAAQPHRVVIDEVRAAELDPQAVDPQASSEAARNPGARLPRAAGPRPIPWPGSEVLARRPDIARWHLVARR